MLEFSAYSYVWIPRNRDINGPSSDLATDITYFPLGANRGWFFFSDTPALAPPAPVNTGRPYFQMVLPSWFPRKVYITRVTVVWDTMAPFGPSDQGQIVVWIDPKGIAYNTGGMPPGSDKGAEFGSDLTRQKQMVICFGYRQDFVYSEKFEVPYLLDRDAGDKLVFQVNAPQELANVGAVFDFLVPTTQQPVALTGY